MKQELIKQKFEKGDLVKIIDVLRPSMSHFPSGTLAIVQHSYKDAHGGDESDEVQYSLLVREKDGRWRSNAWYYEKQLTFFDLDTALG